jgi:hypothetical protein
MMATSTANLNVQAALVSLPYLGTWRVRREKTDVGDNSGMMVGTCSTMRNLIATMGGPKSEPEVPFNGKSLIFNANERMGQLSLRDMAHYTRIASNYGFLNKQSSGYELSAEKGVLKHLESAGIQEANQNVFSKCPERWCNADLVGGPRRPPIYDKDNDFDYYIDVYPVDVKTMSSQASESTNNKKLLIKRKMLDEQGKKALTPDEQTEHLVKKAALDDKIALKMKSKEVAVLEKKLPATLDDLSDGLYGSVSAVVKKIKKGGFLLYHYKDAKAVAGFDEKKVAERLKIGKDQLATVRVIPYIVVDTGFLLDKHKDKFWTLLGQRLDANELKHVIEVHSCTHSKIMAQVGYIIAYNCS